MQSAELQTAHKPVSKMLSHSEGLNCTEPLKENRFFILFLPADFFFFFLMSFKRSRKSFTQARKVILREHVKPLRERINIL